jgi:hypothetical protein
MTNETLCKMVAQLTDQNAHTKAIWLAARALGFKALATQVELVQDLQDIEGHMPEELLRYRESLRKRLLFAACAKLSSADYHALESAF